MNDIDIYKIWAPENAKWVNWVRPVQFIGIDNINESYNKYEFVAPNITYLDKDLENVAIIIDLPNEEAIEEGIAFAKLGYRPIPLYNGTDSQEKCMSVIDNYDIKFGLIWATKELKQIDIKENANPVFLLDSTRVNRYRMNYSIFDNSWDIYGQDMPSGKYFNENNINSIIVVANKLQKDLKKVLYRIQKENIQIYFTNRIDVIKKIKIFKPRNLNSE